MHAIYNFVSGPLIWVSFVLFIGGTVYRLVSLGRLAKKKDPMVFSYMSPYYGVRSIIHWILPFASTNSRKNPVLTIVTFVFHICLLIVPVFLLAHVVLWKESWNISWWYLSDGAADVMTLVVMAACVYFLVRRMVRPEVRYLTTTSDFLILAIVALPFVTGFWITHQWAGYRLMVVLHILAGEIFLVAIPFTKLNHMFLFPFMRGYIGSEFGGVRRVKDW